jgi:CBS domain-containing protein
VEIFSGVLGQGLWLILLGWFLNSAAMSSYQRALVTETLGGITVSRVMRTSVDRIPPDITLEQLVREHLIAGDQRAFPVELDDQLLGVVSREDVQRTPHALWPTTRVIEVMTPVERLSTLPPDAAAENALSELSRDGVDQIPVVDHGRLLGLVMRGDLARWIALRQPGHTRGM